MDERTTTSSSAPPSAAPRSPASPPPPPPPAAELVGAPPPPPPSAPRGKLKILRPLKHRDFALLWTGTTVSMVGDGVYLVAIPFQVFALSNVPTALSIVGVAWTVPQLLFLLFGGVVTDRLDRRTVLIGSDLTRAASIGTVAVLSLAGALELWHLYILVAIFGVGEAFYLPAFGAIVPDVVPKDLLVEANSLDEFARPVAFRLAGPALGGLLIATLGIGEAFLFDAATFVLSAGAVLLMKPRPAARLESASARSALSELREAFRFVRSRSWLWGGLLATAVALLAFYGPWVVLVPFIIKNKLGGDASDFSIVLAAGGVGSILASLVLAQRGMARRPMVYVFVVWSTAVLLLAAFALVSAPWQALIPAFFLWGLVTAGQIVWGTLQHQRVPRELLGRVSGLDWLISTVPIPISFALAGIFAAALSAEATLIGAGVLGAVTVSLFLLLPGIRNMRGDEAAPSTTLQPERAG